MWHLLITIVLCLHWVECLYNDYCIVSVVLFKLSLFSWRLTSIELLYVTHSIDKCQRPWILKPLKIVLLACKLRFIVQWMGKLHIQTVPNIIRLQITDKPIILKSYHFPCNRFRLLVIVVSRLCMLYITVYFLKIIVFSYF